MSDCLLRQLPSHWFGNPVSLRFDVYEIVNSLAFIEFGEYTDFVPKHLFFRSHERVTEEEADMKHGGLMGAASYVVQYRSLFFQLAFKYPLPKSDIGWRVGADGPRGSGHIDVHLYLGHRKDFQRGGALRRWDDSALRRDLLIVSAVQKTLEAALIVSNALSPRSGD